MYLQYWLFSTYNSHDRGILRTGRHEGDWELFQLSVGAGGEPVAGTLTHHSSAEPCSWQQFERDGPAPRVYVANGSHALYRRRGIVPGEQPSPRGPAFQDIRWSDPAGFEAGARACGTPPPGLRWLVPALIASACLGLAWFALRRRHARLVADR